MLSSAFVSFGGGVLIGLGAALLLVVNGRLAGVSGIVAGLLPPFRSEIVWRAVFVFGLLIVGALTAWGALERDAEGLYHVGLRLWELAALAPRGLALRQAALPYLEDLYEATHENVQLAVRDGAEAVYIEWLAGRSAVGVHIRVGARWPLHATGVGLALLAHETPGFQEDYCSGPLAAFTPYCIAR